MLKFAKKLLLFVVIFFLFDKTFLFVADLSAKSEVDKRLEYILNGRINKDIIVIGSSLGSRDIIAGQIEDKTGYATYNLCYPGSNTEFQEFVLRTLLKFNNHPKIVLLVVDDNTEFKFDELGTVIYRTDRLYPLVKYSYIRNELVARGEKDWFLSKFLFLHNLNKSNFDLRKKKFSPIDTILNCGSMPISWKKGIQNWNYLTGERVYIKDDEKVGYVDAYKKIVTLCEINDIKLVIVFPPLYKTHSILFENRVRELSGEHAYFYVYNPVNSIYMDKAFYFDDSHLIKKAAILFTDELIVFLNNLTQNEYRGMPGEVKSSE